MPDSVSQPIDDYLTELEQNKELEDKLTEP